MMFDPLFYLMRTLLYLRVVQWLWIRLHIALGFYFKCCTVVWCDLGPVDGLGLTGMSSIKGQNCKTFGSNRIIPSRLGPGSTNMLYGGTVRVSKCYTVVWCNLGPVDRFGLTGTSRIKGALSDTRNLQSFDVSSNNIAGKIPKSLSNSFNNFEGMIPSGGIFNSATNMSFLGNPRLRGAASRRPICPQKKHWFRSPMLLIILIIVILVSVLLSALGCVILICRIKLKVSSRKTERSRKPPTPEIRHNFPRITCKELSEATRGFYDHNLIGTGSYGRVYRGVLQDGTSIAVKVLHLQSENSTKSYNRECQVLKSVRHRNLIRIIAVRSLPDFKALVLPYMANGSFDSRLYPHSESGLSSGSSDLSLTQKVSICSDIAEGMAYLHHHSPVRVIHCDLNRSNILLNDDMTALVSDFGIARLVMAVGAGNGSGATENMGNSTPNMLAGSIGYIAPGNPPLCL
ncbi:putative leucine-rich repeat receptor-like serine/threonine-protein kinase At2g24130 [Durio zibethinus]|uniref:Leucine-rich repeat receptor-like serine/threonine-protein kinase At2g24130 n=1 Tax=Durio zibethinus TaxID=66656 RepID=A0A6P5WKR5_DURZI|nr:putative leucine-rich repeat receptor-like serine/threonine-protein kinase At2g24130 [Durio zibethinus]